MSGIKFMKQNISLPVRNIDKFINRTKQIRRKHNILFPNSIRCIICGPYNCGKTNVIISLLEDPNGLRFENVYIYSKSLYQPKYKYIKLILSYIEGIKLFLFSSNEEIVPLENVRPNSIFIFDDVICDKQNIIKSYFCMGRHKGIDCFYLSQSYAHISKHLIRENTNFIILFKQDITSLKHIFNDFNISTDMTFNDFHNLCNSIWKTKYDFIVIDCESDVNEGRYRKGFDNFILIKEKC